MSTETRVRALLLQFKLSQGEANRVRQEIRAFRGDLAQIEQIQREIRTTAMAGAEGEGRLARAMRESAQAAKLAGTGYDQSAKELRDLTHAASDAERQLKDTNAAAARATEETAKAASRARSQSLSRGERGFASSAQLLGIVSPQAAEGARVIADTLGVLDDVPEAFAAIRSNAVQFLSIAGPTALAIAGIALAISRLNAIAEEGRQAAEAVIEAEFRRQNVAVQASQLTRQEAELRSQEAEGAVKTAQDRLALIEGLRDSAREALTEIENKDFFSISSEDIAEALRLRSEVGRFEEEIARINREELAPALADSAAWHDALAQNLTAANDGMAFFTNQLKSVPSVLEFIAQQASGFFEQSRAATKAAADAQAVATDIYVAKTEDYKEKTDDLTAAQARLLSARQAVHEAEKQYALALEQIAADLQAALDKATADRGAAIEEAERDAEFARSEALRDAQHEREKLEEEHVSRLAEINRRGHAEQASAIGRRDVLAFIESKERQKEAVDSENASFRQRKRDIERNLRETLHSINLRLNEQRRTIEQRYNEQLRVAHEKARQAILIEQQRAQAELAIRQQAVQTEINIMNQLAKAIKALLGSISVPTPTPAQSVPIPKGPAFSGNIPTFQTGGRITRSGLAFVDRGEVILNRRQQGRMGGITFAPVIHGSTRRQIEKQVVAELHSLLTDVGVD